MAVLKFRVYYEEDDSVYRDVVLKHNQHFLELHQIILKSFEFDNKHQATFFRSNDHWQRGREISLEKYDREYKAPPLMMAETTIGSEIRDPNQKFVYLYDFAKNWSFLVELINVTKEESSKLEYPAMVKSEGIGPSQYGNLVAIHAFLFKAVAVIDSDFDGRSIFHSIGTVWPATVVVPSGVNLISPCFSGVDVPSAAIQVPDVYPPRLSRRRKHINFSPLSR